MAGGGGHNATPSPLPPAAMALPMRCLQATTRCTRIHPAPDLGTKVPRKPALATLHTPPPLPYPPFPPLQGWGAGILGSESAPTCPRRGTEPPPYVYPVRPLCAPLRPSSLQGWDAGILGGDGIPPMKEGGKRRLRIPSDLAYGGPRVWVGGGGCARLSAGGGGAWCVGSTANSGQGWRDIRLGDAQQQRSKGQEGWERRAANRQQGWQQGAALAGLMWVGGETQRRGAPAHLRLTRRLLRASPHVQARAARAASSPRTQRCWWGRPEGGTAPGRERRGAAPAHKASASSARFISALPCRVGAPCCFLLPTLYALLLPVCSSMWSCWASERWAERAAGMPACAGACAGICAVAVRRCPALVHNYRLRAVDSYAGFSKATKQFTTGAG